MMQALSFYSFVIGGLIMSGYGLFFYVVDKKAGKANKVELLMMIIPALIMFGGAYVQRGAVL